MSRIIFHIDVNSAYLSWTAVEQLKHGAQVDIRTIPAIIGGDQKSRHGIVLAKSIPAKKYGIRTGEPVANALRKCPGIRMEPPDHALYSAYSREMMDFLRTYTPDIEQVSVDECYLDFTGSPTGSTPASRRPLRSRTGSGRRSASRSMWASPPTSCWQRWHRTSRSRTGSTPCSRRRSGLRCGPCLWASSTWPADPAWRRWRSWGSAPSGTWRRRTRTYWNST